MVSSSPRQIGTSIRPGSLSATIAPFTRFALVLHKVSGISDQTALLFVVKLGIGRKQAGAAGQSSDAVLDAFKRCWDS